MDQIELHKKIDDLIKNEPTDSHIDAVKKVLETNFDIRHYFFSRVGPNWLDWLWRNGFMDLIKQKEEDPTRFSYKTPELDYLVRMVESDPETVVRIIQKVETSESHLNKEVIDRFIWIIHLLEPDQIATLVSRIRDERWPKLMGAFNHLGFTYEKIFQKLSEAKDFKSVVILADAVLTLKTKEEISKTNTGFSTGNPFYFDDIHYIKVFEYLNEVDSQNLTDALKLVTSVMKGVVLAEGKDTGNELFEIRDAFSLFDVDFFNVEVGQKKALSIRDDVRDLAAVMKNLTQKSIGTKCDDDSKKIYEDYIVDLPKSQSMWRFQLFVLSLCPELFKDELQKRFNRVFESDQASSLVSGTEYCKALKKSFAFLDPEFKKTYIDKVFVYFGDSSKEEWYRRDGLRIISSIFNCIDPSDVETIREKTKSTFNAYPDPVYEPEPSIGRSRSGYVSHKAPVDIETVREKSVEKIVASLKGEWTPDNIQKLNAPSEDSFFSPISSEGLSSLLKINIKERLIDYVNSAPLFFDREKLDAQYTYAFFTGIYEAIRENKSLDVSNWDGLFILINNIITNSQTNPFDNKPRDKGGNDYWLASWTAVHSSIGDSVKEFLGENKEKEQIDFTKYQKDIENVILYLLSYPDPDETDNARESGDPFTTAINSVRGRAFQALTLYVYRSQKLDNKNGGVSENVKNAFQTLVKSEYTYAIMFMIGHYLPSFYYRDEKKEWIPDLLPYIFSEDSEKKDLYLSAWEGYLATNLYKELFDDFQKLYERAINLDPSTYTKRGYFRKLDEGLATHIALAYIYFEDFTIDSPLFKMFWDNKNEEQHKEFVSFIGRHAISKDQAKEWMASQKIDSKKLLKLWDWILKNCTEIKTLKAFGFWMNLEGKAFEVSDITEKTRKTFEKTGGEIDWEYGLINSLQDFVTKDPEEALKILRLYFTAKTNIDNQSHGWLHVDEKMVAIFRGLYKNHSEEIRNKTYTLISELLPLGNGQFWKLKDAIE